MEELVVSAHEFESFSKWYRYREPVVSGCVQGVSSTRNIQRHSHPILQAAHSHQKQAISSHISTLAEKLISKEKDIQLDAHWNNESEVKDKTKIAEEKMYQGWNL